MPSPIRGWGINMQVSVCEDDIRSSFRLGRQMDNRWRCTSSRKTPAHCYFNSQTEQQKLIMENLYRVKHLESQFKNVIFAHDMTKQERTECKIFVEDPKKTNNSRQFGTLYTLVNVATGIMKIIRFLRSYTVVRYL